MPKRLSDRFCFANEACAEKFTMSVAAHQRAGTEKRVPLTMISVVRHGVSRYVPEHEICSFFGRVRRPARAVRYRARGLLALERGHEIRDSAHRRRDGKHAHAGGRGNEARARL